MLGMLLAAAIGLTTGMTNCGSSGTSQETEKIKKELDELKKQKEDEKLTKQELAKEQDSLTKEKQKLDSAKKKTEVKPKEKLPDPKDPNAHLPTGDWFVVLGSFSKSEQSAAEKRKRSFGGMGFSADVIDTDDFPGFQSGLLAVVIGPVFQSEAKSTLSKLKGSAPDAYIKSGW